MQGLCQLLLVSTSSPSSISLTGSNAPDYLPQSSILPTSTANSATVNSMKTATGVSSSGSVDFDLLRSTMLYHQQWSLLSPITHIGTSRLSSDSLMRIKLLPPPSPAATTTLSSTTTTTTEDNEGLSSLAFGDFSLAWELLGSAATIRSNIGFTE
ncbi:hypothetical protein JCM5350_002390 [Sporobolomyces pararoseus]